MKKILVISLFMTFISCAHQSYKVTKSESGFKVGLIKDQTRDLASSKNFYQDGLKKYYFSSAKEKAEFVKEYEDKYSIKKYKSTSFNENY